MTFYYFKLYCLLVIGSEGSIRIEAEELFKPVGLYFLDNRYKIKVHAIIRLGVIIARSAVYKGN